MFRKIEKMKQELDFLLSTSRTLSDAMANIRLVYYYLPIKQNGFSVIHSKGKSQYIIGLNLYRDAELPEMGLFYLLVTLFHELEHIQLDKAAGQSCATMEQWYLEAERATCDNWKHHFVGMITSLSFPPKKTRNNKRYQTSVNELHCIYCSYRDALNYGGECLGTAEREKIEKILESLEFILQHLEITYTNRNAPVSKFPHLLKQMEKSAKKKGIPPSDTCLSSLYNHDWSRKSLSELFAQREWCNFDLIDNLVIQLFVHSKLDFETEFKANPQLQCYIEVLIDNYLRKMVDYIKNYQLASVYLSDEVLKDNNAMVIKEMELLQNLSQKYDFAPPSDTVMVLK